MAGNWKGSISFGLIYIPITLQIATAEERINFNQLHSKCYKRIKYKKTCPECDDMDVKAKDIVKGYEYDKEKYVVFDESDFNKLKTDKDKSIVIERFVNLEDIDPLYYEKSYHIIPQGAQRAYKLLIEAMSQEDKVGIAKVVLGEKESVIALRVNDGKMILSTLFFNSEIKSSTAPEITINIDEKELEMAKSIINNMTKPYEPEVYHNIYNERLMQAIEKKIKGEEIITPDKDSPNTTIDLMDALQASLAASKENTSNVSH